MKAQRLNFLGAGDSLGDSPATIVPCNPSCGYLAGFEEGGRLTSSGTGGSQRFETLSGREDGLVSCENCDGSKDRLTEDATVPTRGSKGGPPVDLYASVTFTSLTAINTAEQSFDAGVRAHPFPNIVNMILPKRRRRLTSF